MAAYAISDVQILDQVRADMYRALAESSIQRHGGRYLVRGARPEAMEGTWPVHRRLVIVEFPSMARLHDWYSGPEYAEALEIRRVALDRRLLFVDGLPS